MTLPEEDIARLLESFAPPVGAMALDLIRFVNAARPEMKAKVQFGWRSVNFRHPKAGFVCAVFPYADRVALVFEHGRLLDNAGGLLEGDGSQVRFVCILPGATLPEDGIALLLAEAIAFRA